MISREHVTLNEDIEVTVNDRDQMRSRIYQYKKGDSVILIRSEGKEYLLDYTNDSIVLINAAFECNYTVGG